MRRFPEVTPQEVRRFLTLNDEQQFEDLLLLRTRAAHFGAGSLAAFTALYISVILFAVPLIIESLPGETLGIPPALIPTVGTLAAGIWIAFAFVQEQHNMARAAARLAFYEEALDRNRFEDG